MTSGTIQNDHLVDYPVTYTYYPGGSVVVSSTPTKRGDEYKRAWSGSDTLVKTPFTYRYWREPSWYKVRTIGPYTSKKRKAYPRVRLLPGRLHKRRVYQNGQRKATDHPYWLETWYRNHRPVELTYVETSVPGYTVTDTTTKNLRPIIGSASNYIDANDKIKLAGRLRSKVAGSDFNMGIFLAEGHQAAQMIGDAAIRLARSMTLVKQGRIGAAADALVKGASSRVHAKHRTKMPTFGAKSASRDASSNWLELQYGWLPLLSDVYAGAEFLAHYLNYPMSQTYRVKFRKELKYPASYWTENRKGSQDRLQIIAHVSEVDVPQLIGLTDPASILWEKLPYSFVADWFIPIGSWLSARGLSSSLTGRFVTSYKSIERNSISAYKLSNSQHTTTGVFPEGPSHGYYCWFERTLHSTLSDALGGLKPPNFKPLAKVASWQHAANAVALLTQVFTK